ncbi:hypothetical protein [Luteolibacter sp. Populi]|uniref:hypothetical protein n=1 Tax=Luteolibacter sp. Populi TaxID=3230487 RepID=UPI0034670B51
MSRNSSLLHSEALWPAITKAAKEKRAQVAVAYVGRDAPRYLPLKKDSVLICDFSISALKRGLSHPDAILAYLETGVEVHSWEGLHAKVFSFGGVAFVGSCNASSRSANGLIEAALRTTAPATIREVTDFIMSLRGIRIGPEFVKSVAHHYRPPAGEKSNGQALAAMAVPLWVADVSEHASDEAGEQAKRGEKSVRKLLSKGGGHRLDWFEWYPGIPKAIRENAGEILMIHDDGSGARLYPPARYLRTDEIPGTGSKIIWVEYPAAAEAIFRGNAIRKLGAEFGKRLKEIGVSREIRHREFAKRLRQLW